MSDAVLLKLIPVVITIPGGPHIAPIGMSRPPGDPQGIEHLILMFFHITSKLQSQRICRTVVKSATIPGIIVTGEQDKIPALSRDLGDRQRDVFYACVHLAGKLRKKLFSFCLICFQLPDQFLPAGL